MGIHDHSAQWYAAVRRLRTRVNFIALLDRAGLALCCAAAVCAFLAYLFRRLDVSLWYAGGAIILIMAGCLGWAWFAGKNTRFRDTDARALLDEQLGLHGALSAEQEIRVTLPDYTGNAGQVCRWSPGRPLSWIGGAMTLILCGLFLPLPAKDTVSPGVRSVPPAFAQIETWLGQLEQEERIEQDSVEPFRRQLEELFKQSIEDMYTHASLEAVDALKSHTESAIRQFARDTGTLGAALSELESQLNNGGEIDTRDLSAALEALETAPLQPGGELAGALGQIDPQHIRQLDPEQMKRLAQQLQKASGEINRLCRGGQAGIADPDDPSFNQGMGPLPLVEGDGGIDRGRGDAPLAFSDKGVEPMGEADGRLESPDLSRAALGEQVGIQRGGHETDPSRTHAAGRTDAAGNASRGGDAAWTDNVTPREREALRKVFD